jgi:hypothetical protein
MTESDPDGLLARARTARAEADRSRRLARQISDDQSRDTLRAHADRLEAEAEALERQARAVAPPVVQRHAQPQQMQQAQVAQPDQDDDTPAKPAKSD